MNDLQQFRARYINDNNKWCQLMKNLHHRHNASRDYLAIIRQASEQWICTFLLGFPSFAIHRHQIVRDCDWKTKVSIESGPEPMAVEKVEATGHNP
jgi:hypothetical protein